MPDDTAALIYYLPLEEKDKNTTPSGNSGSGGGGNGDSDDGSTGDADDIYYTTSAGIPLASPPAPIQSISIPAPSTSSPPPPPPSTTFTTSTTPSTPTISVATLFILKTFDDNDAILSFADITTSWRHTDPFPVVAHTTIHRENAAVAASSSTPSESFGSVTRMSEQGGSPTSVSSSVSSSRPPPGGSAGDSQNPPPQNASHPPIGAIVIVPIVIIVLTIIAVFLWRRKRKARKVSAARVQEMRMRDQEEALPEYSAPAAGATVVMPYMIASPAGGTTTGTGSIGPTSSAANDDPGDNSSAPPVILSNTIQSAYMTGLDTSDNMSTTSSSNHHTQSSTTGITTPGNRLSYDARSMSSADEPPPPYRPASVPPISRETSLRYPTSASNNLNQVLAPLSEATRSSYDGTDDYHVADGLRNPFAGGSRSETASVAEENDSLNNPFDDQDDVSIMTRSSRHSHEEEAQERHPALDERLETRCCVSRPGSMVV